MRHYSFIAPTFGARLTQLAICQSIYDANAFNIQNWKKGFKINPDMLPEAVISFLQLMESMKIDFCIVGEIAYLAYIQDRNTKDLDILISVKELKKLLPHITVISQDVNFVNAEFEGIRIDFLKTSNPLFDYVKRRETTAYKFAEGEYPIATINGLILMRFDAIIDLHQKGNFNKIVRYETDLRFLTINYKIQWKQIWKISAKFFTGGQIAEFKKMITPWRQPRTNPFA